jgi:D-glycero-D-manno-heptose 1,7-bisphosphate phosphatase
MEDRSCMNRAIFIDKDGTLVHDVPYNVNPDLITYQEGAFSALKRLKEQGYLLIIVSNQSGIARGFFTEEEIVKVKNRIDNDLRLVGVTLDAFYFCPHHPCGIVDKYGVVCECRKPEPGMLIQAASEFDIDLSKSWMIGDILNDVEAGNRAGCKTILLNNGNETEWESGKNRYPTFMTSTLEEAAEIIVSMEVYYAEC